MFPPDTGGVECHSSSRRSITSSLLLSRSCDGYNDKVDFSGVCSCRNASSLWLWGRVILRVGFLKTTPGVKRWAGMKNDNIIYVRILTRNLNLPTVVIYANPECLHR